MKAKWIQDLYKTTDASFIGIQELFKTVNLNKSFLNWFPEHNCYVEPGNRETRQDNGRAKGGLAQLIKKSHDIQVQNVRSDSYRIQAQLLKLPRTNLRWFNVYFPTDTQIQYIEPGELVEVTQALENIMDKTEFDDVLIQGDLNWDNRRDSGHSIIMRDFLERIGLKSVWDNFPVSYTHIHTDMKSTSILDNFLLNERLLACVEDAGVMHLGDNMSRHSPIMLKIRVDDIHVKQQQDKSARSSHPAWYKATDDDIDNYTAMLQERLWNMESPEILACNDVNCSDPQHRQDRDSHVLDLLVAMIESSHGAIPLTKPFQDSQKKVKNIPGWKEHVEPFRSDALFWHSVWLRSGKPNSGELHRVMCWSRNKFHYAVRKLRRISHNVRAEELLEASEAGDIELMKAMQEIKGKKSTCQTMPDIIEGETEHHEILDKFRKVYAQLYNSAESKEAMDIIKDKLKGMVNKANSCSVINLVTADVVKKACGKMKAGKADVSGSYSSEVLLHGPDELFEHLAAVFRSFLVHGEVTEQLLCCAFLPLFKGGLKDPSKTDSYRAIAGSSLLLKLFDNVVLLLWGHLLASDSLQFGYKSGTSTTQCTWMVREVAEYYQKRGTPIICVTLDCSKAFDKCRFDKLFQKLLDRAVPAVVIRVLVYVYEEQKACVKLLDHRSESFGITNGTRQGSVLSPALFSVYLDELLKELRQLRVGCHVGGWWYGAACYADDLILLAPARTAAVMMLECCERYAKEHNLQFSTDPVPEKSKSKCIYFCGKLARLVKPHPLTLLGKQLPWVASADHLGLVLN